MSNAIGVKYKFIDGAHFFLGTDELSEGLCVAHTDLKTAFNAVAAELEFLLKNNHQQVGKIEPGAPFEHFQGKRPSDRTALTA